MDDWKKIEILGLKNFFENKVDYFLPFTHMSKSKCYSLKKWAEVQPNRPWKKGLNGLVLILSSLIDSICLLYFWKTWSVNLFRLCTMVAWCLLCDFWASFKRAKRIFLNCKPLRSPYAIWKLFCSTKNTTNKSTNLLPSILFK